MKYIPIIALTIAVVSAVAIVGARAHGNLEWVRGQYGSKCYLVGSEHKNIKYPVYFKSYTSCIESL